MKNRKMFLAVLLSVLSFGSVCAIDLKSFADPITPGSLLISGGFGVGSTTWSSLVREATLGFTFSADYALPVMALTIGGEIGFSGSPELDIGMVPIAARIGWHPNWGIHENLDLYGLYKMGIGIGTSSQSNLHGGAGFLIGFLVGGKWFFNPNFAVSLETGVEGSWPKYKFSGWSLGRMFTGKYLTLGVTYKLDLKKSNS
jgi:hypothetical protein